MTLLDDIINRRKKGADGSERREFTVDRTRAIEKMRRFALEDPRYYLLELIQAAIANGAGFMSIDLFRLRTRQDDLKMRWNGRGFSSLELSRLFDFLFISDDEPGCADTILLARGVNAMLHFRPKKITISCGDGTIDGSRCFVIRPDQSEPTEVELVETVDGIKLHADALRNSLLPPEADQGLGAREVLMLEEKCIAPKVRVMLNGRWVSDWNAAYSEQMKTGSDYVEIDEPDLYGRLWKTMGSRPSRFDLMTWGVKIESVEHEESPFEGLSGAINYDRLTKTADHARIVRDEVLDELWARLSPYASKLQRRTGEATYDIYDLAGERYRPQGLLELVRGAERIVVVAPTVLEDDKMRRKAAAIGDALEVPVVVAWEGPKRTLRMLGGSACEFVEPSLDGRRDLEVFTSQPASPPPRPWLTEPLNVESIAMGEFVRRLCELQRVDDGDRALVEEALGAGGEVDLRIFTPERDDDNDGRLGGRWVSVLVCERLVWEGEVDTVFPGHRLFVELPALSPSALDKDVCVEVGFRGRREIRLLMLVAKTAVTLARRQLRRASERALRALSRVRVQPGTLAARIGLNALGRAGLLRVRSDADTGDSKIDISIFDDESIALLDVALFRSVDGQMISARQIGRMLHEHGGLIYGTLEGNEADLGGLDTSRVLALDAEQERFVVALVGADAYVRVDEREVLAEHRGVEVRDVAVGLREYPQFPLWVEGADPRGMSSEERRDIVAELVRQLVARLSDEGRRWHHQEARRQARRHLLHYLFWCETSEDAFGVDGVDELLLVDTVEGGRCSFRDLMAAMESAGQVVMADGRAVARVRPIGLRQPAAQSQSESTSERIELRMNPFLLYLTQEIGPVKGAFDFDLSRAEAIQNEDTPDTAFIAAEHIDDHAVRGVVGLPVEPVEQHIIAVIERVSRDVHLLREPARQLGLVGRVVVDAQTLERPDRLSELVVTAGEKVLERLVEVAARLEAARARRRVIDAVLSFAAKHLEFRTTDSGGTCHTVDHPLAERILELPLFPTDTGTPVSGRSLADQFCRAADAGEPFSSPLSEHASPSVRRWVEENLDPSTIYSSAPVPISDAAGSMDHRSEAGGDLLELLARWLDKLWPDGAREAFDGWLELDWQDGDAGADRARMAVCEQSSAGEIKLSLARTHPLVKRVQQAEEPDSESFAWLLLAVFAELNARLESVTNEHELAFQRRVADWLESGG